MGFLDRLEHRYGRYAIPGLIHYIVALNALVYVLIKRSGLSGSCTGRCGGW
jgi:hypothetical protein